MLLVYFIVWIKWEINYVGQYVIPVTVIAKIVDEKGEHVDGHEKYVGNLIMLFDQPAACVIQGRFPLKETLVCY